MYAYEGYCNSPLNKRISIIIAVVFSLIGFPHKSLCQIVGLLLLVLCVFNLACLCSVLCYIFLSLHNKWYHRLDLKEQRMKEKIIWSLDRREG